MRLSDAAVQRPVAMSCLIIALALLGLNAYRNMGLELMPKIDIPFITVVTVYPGATPAEIETDVARRIEDAVVSVDGLKHVTSLCTENVCQTFLEFDLAVDVDITATDVREQIDLVRATLPADVEDPQILKFDLNAQPIITLALTGDAPLAALYDFADNELKDRITTIPGVATVELIGGAKREMHVLLDRERLAGRGLSSLDVVTAIRQGVATIPAGRVRDAGNEINLTFDADVASAADLAALEVRHGGDQRCRIRDIGRVEMRTAEQRQAARVDGRDAVAIRVVKKGDANAVRVTEAVRAAMGRLQQELPGGMDLVWVTDDGRFIEATNASAWSNVIQGILLTAAILFLFLYNLRSLLVVAVTMPLTVIIGLFFMQMVGFTLNSSTLIAIGLSVGVLVTNAIVVLEAIIARLQDGQSPREAARLGADQAWIAVLASAGTNVVVLFPLAIMPSLIGLWIQPLAVTMFIMTVVSLFISFTLTPLLCSLLLRPADAGRRGLLAACERGWNRGLERVIAGYRRLLVAVHRRRSRAVLVLVAVLGLLVHAMATAGSLGSSMVEEPDRGEVYVKLEFPTRYALERTRARVEEAVDALAGLPGLEHSLAMVGKIDAMEGQISEGVYLAQILLRFAHRTERAADIDALLAAVRARLADYPGAIITVSQPGMVGGQAAEVEMEIAGPELSVLEDTALAAQAHARRMPGIRDPDTTVRSGKPEVRARPRRDVLAGAGLPPRVVGTVLRGNVEGLEAGVYKQRARNYDIVVRYDRRDGREQIAGMPFPAGPGHTVGLDALAELEPGHSPVLIARKNKRRIAKLFANLAPWLPLGQAVERLDTDLHAQGILPPGYDIRFAGSYEYMSEAQTALGEAALMAIVLVVLTLAAILESFRQPLIILLTLPLALIGVIDALALAGGSLGIFEIMGMVMLIGIVVNNAILIIDRYNILRRDGKDSRAAMVAAAGDRFRPVLMITVAAVLGMLPLALSTAIGAELRNGVGIASAGGILVAGILTMVVIPVLPGLRRPPRD